MEPVRGKLTLTLLTFPIGDSCDEHTQRRIAKAAETYLREQKLEDDDDGKPDWYFTNSIPRIEYFAYFAIFLLHKIDVDVPRWRMEECLRKWSKIVVWFPFTCTSALMMVVPTITSKRGT